jgi:catechol 2,3-dioxygenase-like lactoylglutathione lyase family enzyme
MRTSIFLGKRRMLSTSLPIVFIATATPERARAFYADTLGLTLITEDEFSLVFALHGVALRIQKVRELLPQPFTALGWQVADAAGTVAALRARGVAFERYPFLQQDAHDIWDAPGGARIAWFKDSDGNLLSVTEVRAA